MSGAYGNPGSGNPWEGAAATAKAAAEKEAHGAAHRGHLWEHCILTFETPPWWYGRFAISGLAFWALCAVRRI
jgi:hypothetical protein